MPRRREPPRLYLRERRGRAAIWVILDDGREVSTGLGRDQRAEAHEALAVHIHEKGGRPGRTCAPGELSVAQALDLYAREHAPSVRSPATIGYAIQALLPFWGELKVAAVKGETCRRYHRERDVADGTARRELGVLRSALVHCQREGYLTEAPLVWLPPTSIPRHRWLTRSEAARLIEAAKPWPHLQRFVLVGLYTASRSGVVRGLQWEPNPIGGHVDLERGVMYRQPIHSIQSRKRATPVRIPPRLLRHLRRWEGTTRQWVVEYRGEPVQSLKTSWGYAREAAGLDRDVVPHSLRHTAITWLCQKGVARQEIESFAAVTSAEMERTYLHHHPDFQKGAAEAFGR